MDLDIDFDWIQGQVNLEFKYLKPNTTRLTNTSVKCLFTGMMLTFERDIHFDGVCVNVHDTHPLSPLSYCKTSMFQEHLYTKGEICNWLRLVRTWYEMSVVPPRREFWSPKVRECYHFEVKWLKNPKHSVGNTIQMIVFPQNDVWAIGFGLSATRNKHKHILTHKDTLEDAQRFVEAWFRTQNPWVLAENPRVLRCTNVLAKHDNPEIHYVDGMWRSDLTAPTDDPLMAIRMFEQACNDV